ncbi:MAG: replicative DNA helicase [Phycisphaeraceae bacterium]|nr:MAG: replicative DNA helicase [Phycisphaeraceae bacterium]
MTRVETVTESKPRPGSREGRERRPADPVELARLFEKLPPHAVEAEMSLLGSMMLDPTVIGEVVQVLRTGDDFFKPAHGAIFDAIVELYDKHSRLDLIALHQLLLDRNLLDSIGGQDYLAELAMSVPSAAHADYYAALVRDKAMVRRLIRVAGDIIHDAYTSSDKAADILDVAERQIFEISDHYDHSDFETLHALLSDTLKRLEKDEGPTCGLLTGFIDFDHLTGGLQPGELSILAARPSMGKTALALNMAENVASKGHPIGLFSLEMSKGQLVDRLIAGRSGVDVQKLRRNTLSKAELPQVSDACLELSQVPIIVDDMAAITLMQLRAKARRMRTKFNIEAIFIDYLQLITLGSRTESRQVEVSEISRGLKALARELEVPVVCMAQLNRGPEQREGHRPRLSDLRESGSIEQDADVVLLLHREDYYHKEEPDYQPNNEAELIIAKQRNGPVGVAKLHWNGRTTRFENLSYATPSGPYVE